jgi:(S)-sulfolactate dehydrogenase
MARIVVCGFRDERAVVRPTARHRVLHGAARVDDAALKSGHLGGAAIDVFGREPRPAAPHFDGCPKPILTPHAAGVTAAATARVSFLIADRPQEALH